MGRVHQTVRKRSSSALATSVCSRLVIILATCESVDAFARMRSKVTRVSRIDPEKIMTHTIRGICTCARERGGDIGGISESLGINTGALMAFDDFAETLSNSGCSLPKIGRRPNGQRLGAQGQPAKKDEWSEYK